MQIVKSGIPFTFSYPTYDENAGLFVQAGIYDVTTGTPVLVTLVRMTNFTFGVYSGNYTGVLGKTYLVIALVYTDGTYAVVDTTRAPASECYQTVSASSTFFAFNYATYDQDVSTFIQAKIYDTTTGTAVFSSNFNMVHVSNGVYFGYFNGTLDHSYAVAKVPYTDGTYTTPDSNRAPGADDFQGQVFSMAVVMQAAILSGQTTFPNCCDDVNEDDLPQIIISQGDDAILSLVAEINNGVLYDLTGATFQTQMKGGNGVIVTFPNGQHTPNPDQTNFTGQFSLALSDTDTASIQFGNFQDIVTRIVIGGVVIYFHGRRILNVQANVPLE